MKKTFYNESPKYITIALISFGIFFSGCSKAEDKTSDNQTVNTQSTPAATAAPLDDGKGIGPIKSVDVPANIDEKMAADGKKIFESKCFACHTIDARKVGPALKGVTLRRKPEWIMNQIMNPAEMTQKDPTSKKLLGEYMVQMANQNVDEKGARAILEFFRSNDKK